MSSVTPDNNPHRNLKDEDSFMLLLSKAQQEGVTFTEADILRVLPAYKPNPYNSFLSILKRKVFQMSVISILAILGTVGYLIWSPQHIQQPQLKVATNPHEIVSTQEVQQPYQDSLQKIKPKNVQTEKKDITDTAVVKVYELKMTSDTLISTGQLMLLPDGNSSRKTAVAHSWNPDSITLSKLGFTVYGKDSIVHTVVEKLGESGYYKINRSAYSSQGLSNNSAFVLHKSKLNFHFSNIRCSYLIKENGRVLFFDDVAGYTKEYHLYNRAFKKYGNDSLQKICDSLKKDAFEYGCTFSQSAFNRFGDSVQFISQSIKTTSRDNSHIGVMFNIPEAEQNQYLQEYSQKNKEAMAIYRDSCVAICIKPDGVNPLYFLYYPSPEFLSLLPKNVVLQIRAEQGNEEALRELKANYKGCRLMTHCKSSDGAIEETEVRGSSSSSVQLFMSLSAPRTIRVALYDIRGNLLSEVIQQKEYAQGEYQIPISYNMNSENSMFALLVITSDKGEKVMQRVILEK